MPNKPTVRVICTVGGSASTYLAKKLGERYSVCRKPDAVLRSSFEIGRFAGQTEFDQRHLENRGAGFRTVWTEKPTQFARDLMDFLDENPSHIAILNTLHEYAFFSRFLIQNVGFLIRDPLDAYISFFKPYRHGRIADELGGLKSRGSMLFFARKWNALVDEYIFHVDKNLKPVCFLYDRLDRTLGNLGLADDTMDFEKQTDCGSFSFDEREQFLELVGNRYQLVLDTIN